MAVTICLKGNGLRLRSLYDLVDLHGGIYKMGCNCIAWSPRTSDGTFKGISRSTISSQVVQPFIVLSFLRNHLSQSPTSEVILSHIPTLKHFIKCEKLPYARTSVQCLH